MTAPPAGRPARRGGYAGPKKSNMPLVVGGVGGGVVVLAIVAILLFGSKSGPADIGGGPDNGREEVAQTPKDPENNVADFSALSMNEKDSYCRTKFAQAGKDLGLHKALYDWYSARSMSGWARRSLDYILKEDAEDDWANQKLGKKSLRTIWERIPEDLDYPNPSFFKLVELMEDGKNWGTAEEYAELEKQLTETLQHAERLSTDQPYLDEYVIRYNVRKDPIFSGYTYEVEPRLPYMIFVEHTAGDSEAELKKAAEIVKRNADILEHLYGEFHKYFGKRFDLVKLEKLERPDQRVMKVFTFFSRKSFQKYQEDIRQRIPPGVRAYYRPDNQWITLYEGGGFEQNAREGESSFNVNKIFHEGTHQLIHFYTKALMERKEGDEVLWTDGRTHSRLHWFQEGIAELVGTSKPRSDGKWDLMQLNRNRLMEWRGAELAKQAVWPLEVLMTIRNQSEMRRKAQELGGITGGGRMASLFYAQAWAFCHFLWNYEDGKYREKLLDYFEKELLGRSGPDEWAKVFWGEKKPDWDSVDKEFNRYFKSLRDQMGIK